MNLIYSFLVYFANGALKLLSHFHPKLKLFVRGRKKVFENLTNSFSKNDSVIWLHAASLGEYEQGLPLLKALKNTYRSHKFLLTFFSPSGYEIKKGSGVTDVIAYLPLDTAKNAERFVEIVNPKLAIFIKYEVWPNYLKELHKRQIPTFLVSAVFKKNQIYFKPWGGFMQKSLKKFSKIFVQDKASKLLLQSIDYQAIEISGDTRFDRVYEIVERDNHLEFMERFKGTEDCLVAGSTWPEDEEILLDYINKHKGLKFVIAPHNIKPVHISELQNAINRKTVRYSQIGNQNPSNFDVLIIDTVGLLTKIYSYADLAYVGGGFRTGLHNTLEPAVFGIPVLIGPNFEGFLEAEILVEKGGVFPVQDKKELEALLQKFLIDEKLRLKTGKINSEFIESNRGATQNIVSHLEPYL